MSIKHGKSFLNIAVGLALGIHTIVVTATDQDTPVVEQLVNTMTELAGEHPGIRKNHAKGVVAEGYFTPSPTAKSISNALHLVGSPSPIIVRYSNATGVPHIGDHNPGSFPKGMAIRFDLGDEGYTDLVCISVNGFPAATPEDFLGLLRAVAETSPNSPSPSPIALFLDNHPAAKAFIETPKLPPKSFATQPFYGVNAFKFINDAGVERYGRYFIEPTLGTAFLTEEEQKGLSEDYLMAELPIQLSNANIEYKIFVQLSEDGDAIDDPTIIWPDSREKVELGTVTLTGMVKDAMTFEKDNMFNPLALPEGIEPSDDPILLSRPSAYAVSFGRRLSGN